MVWMSDGDIGLFSADAPLRCLTIYNSMMHATDLRTVSCFAKTLAEITLSGVQLNQGTWEQVFPDYLLLKLLSAYCVREIAYHYHHPEIANFKFTQACKDYGGNWGYGIREELKFDRCSGIIRVEDAASFRCFVDQMDANIKRMGKKRGAPSQDVNPFHEFWVKLK
ncbi:hypothetical protein BJY04DRAFT_221642 [Aspergillus karnatakaensis]|uniref:uncharacterized protein n=1 Tax=Aspergillus karnatakaensis TaxID=1810916 RepID=UPI003CCDCA88